MLNEISSESYLESDMTSIYVQLLLKFYVSEQFCINHTEGILFVVFISTVHTVGM